MTFARFREYKYHPKEEERDVPIIAYQSFNANSSSDHGLASVDAQRFTLDTTRHAMQMGYLALQLPINTDDLITPIQGPAYRVPVSGLTKGSTSVSAFGRQIASLWQNVYRVLYAMPDIMVCGELDASHSDFASFVTGSLDIESSPATKACQCFTRISQSLHTSQIARLGFGEGYVAYSVVGLNVVFVHVPNRIATMQHEVELFYQDISQKASSGGVTIHLVIGDTNQSSLGFTETALNRAFSTTAYKNALSSAKVAPSDLYGVSQSGTNSTGSKMYDVAVYRSDAVKLVAGPAYISQMSTGLTVTDHCGVAVQIEPI